MTYHQINKFTFQTIVYITSKLYKLMVDEGNFIKLTV